MERSFNIESLRNDPRLRNIQYYLIEDKSGLKELQARILSAKDAYFDTETNGLAGKILLGQFYHPSWELPYVVNCLKIDVFPLLKSLSDITLVAYNANFEYCLLRTNGIHHRKWRDPSLAYLVAWAGSLGRGPTVRYNLALVSKEFLGIELVKEVRFTFLQWDGEDLEDFQFAYAANDVLVLPKIEAIIDKRLEEQNLTHIAELEYSIIPAVGDMNLSGIQIDVDSWRSFLRECEKKKVEVEEELYKKLTPAYRKNLGRMATKLRRGSDTAQELVKELEDKELHLREQEKCANSPRIPNLLGNEEIEDPQEDVKEVHSKAVAARRKSKSADLAASKQEKKSQEAEIDLKSPAQLLAAFGELGADLSDTKEETLKYQKKKNKTVQLLLEHRTLQKLISTYGESMLEMVRPDGRLYASFLQLGAYSTGRFSCKNPNLMNIPIRDHPQYRTFFVAPPGKKLLVADYSQLELKIMAQLSQDPALLDAFRKDLDVHSQSAAKATGRDYDEIVSLLETNKDIAKLRYVFKTINYLTAFGGFAKRLAQEAEISEKEAQEFLDTFSRIYSVLMSYLEKSSVKAVVEDGFSKTILGRKRFFNLTKETPRREFEGMKREARNQPIQGTASDIIKVAKHQMYDDIVRYNLGSYDRGARLINQIHDEFLLEVDEDDIEVVREIVEKAMLGAEKRFLPDVPPAVNIIIGDNWGAKA